MKNPVSATLLGLWGLKKATSRPVPSLRVDERATGKVALVTGANRGLGKSIACQLAERGAHVIMACRTGIPEAGDEVMRASRSAEVSMRALDLADLRDAERLADELANDGVKLDLLVLNAGVVPQSARPTAQGFELMFGVNFLANVLFVERLIERGVLRESGPDKPRIVFVSSESHRGAGPIDFERFGRFETYGGMSGVRVYGYSKLLLNTYAAELAHRLTGRAVVHSVCPGPVNTDIAREAPRWVKPVLSRVMAYTFRAPDAAAEPILKLCCAERYGLVTGTYLHLMEEKPADPHSLSLETRERLLRESQALIALALSSRVELP